VTERVEWVGVDWGTSNLRLWGLAANGSVVLSRSSDQGMGRLTQDQYSSVLHHLLDGVASASGGSIEVLICGMAGARQGWVEAPYLQAPTDLRSLLGGAVRPPLTDAHLTASILPGVCQKAGADNVMRGEETQLLGLAALRPGFAGLVCMPGTHSKWAEMAGTRIEHFSTAMTGELFELLRTHSVLRHSLGGDIDAAERAAGFAAGAQLGLDKPEQLTSELFTVRAGSLLSGRQPGWCAGYSSGLLIGTEIGSRRAAIGTQTVPLIGSPALAALYAQVLAMIGAKGEPVDGTEVVLAGLKAARAFSV